MENKQSNTQVLKHSIIRLIFLFITSLLAFTSNGQSIHSSNKKAIKLYEEAKILYRKYDLKQAQALLNEAVEKDPNFIEAYTLLAYTFLDQNNGIEAKNALLKAVEIDQNAIPNNLYFLGGLEQKSGNYKESKKYYEAYLKTPSRDTQIENKVIQSLENIEFALKELENPLDFKPVNLGPSINSEFPEYFPSLTVDEKSLLFTRRLPSENSPQGFNEDFFLSEKKNNQWQNAYNIGKPINTQLNEGAPTISADGQVLIFTACELYGNYGKDRKGYGSCDLFYSQKVGKNWSEPQNMGPNINTKHWETQPSFSSDGKTLYFIRGIRDRSGNRNGNIYQSKLDSNGYWSKPTPLNNNINTPGNEESVFVHPDNQTLYFSSDGHMGMGGLDIFISRKDSKGEWGEAVNLGFPINSHNNENSLLVSPDGSIAYFASNREEGYGDLDLYQFKLPKKLAPLKATYFAGKIYNKNNNEPIRARFELIDLSNSKTVVESYSDPTDGKFLVTLVSGKEYALNVSKEGFLFYSDNFSLKDNSTNSPYMKDVPLQPIEVGKSIVLKNIFFETGKFDLKKESTAELDKLIEFLSQNPSIVIEVSGHTDNVGSESSNQILSENRAKAVVNYLEKSNINTSRINAKGYGSALPIDSNENEEGRAKNRRTEFKIISK